MPDASTIAGRLTLRACARKTAAALLLVALAVSAWHQCVHLRVQGHITAAVGESPEGGGPDASHSCPLCATGNVVALPAMTIATVPTLLDAGDTTLPAGRWLDGRLVSIFNQSRAPPAT